MRKHSILAIGFVLAAMSTAEAKTASGNGADLQTGRSVAVDRMERTPTAAIDPTLYDGSGYHGVGTATGGPVGGLPGRN